MQHFVRSNEKLLYNVPTSKYNRQTLTSNRNNYPAPNLKLFGYFKLSKCLSISTSC